jgi:hypothetical protein
MFHRFRNLLSPTAGSVAILFGIGAPVMVGVAGIAVDYARYNSTISNLQGLADGAAVAAVRGMAVANTSANTAKSTVDSYVRQKAEEMAWQKGAQDIAVTTQISPAGDAVEVQLSQEWSPMLAHVLFGDVKTPVVIKSTAGMVGTGKACIIGLSESDAQTVYFSGNAKASGNGCGFFSNSTASASFQVDNDAVVSASLMCSAGGSIIAKKGNVTPDVTHDCPPLPDPLADRPAPTYGPCDYTQLEITNKGTTTLPGDRVFCGGLMIGGNAVVDLQPGMYVIKDGPLILSMNAKINGTGVGFFLTGTGARIVFESNTSVSLEAPVSGPMAGLLFYENRANAPVIHRMGSSDARKLLGTIYLPKSQLELNSAADIGSDSAYTALVVNQLRVREGPNVVLNSDYTATNVPVPPGLIGGKVMLTN